jgi:hypothetical protein
MFIATPAAELDIIALTTPDMSEWRGAVSEGRRRRLQESRGLVRGRLRRR